MTRRKGYVLVETLTAMAVLSITAVTVQQGVYTAVQARGLSQDYTTAQFLMDEIIAAVDLEPRVASDDPKTGTFPAPHDRFEYTWSVAKVAVATPLLPAALSPEERATLLSDYVGYMGRLNIEIRWYRGGQPFAVTGETLIAPERVWPPPPGRIP